MACNRCASTAHTTDDYACPTIAHLAKPVQEPIPAITCPRCAATFPLDDIAVYFGDLRGLCLNCHITGAPDA